MRLRRGCERHVRQPEREIERAELRHAHGTMYITLGPCRPDVTLALRMKARWLGRHAVVVLEGRGLFVVFIVIGAARDAHLEVVGRSRAWILPPSGWRLCSSAPELAPRMPLSTLVSHRCPCGYELICDPLPARQSVGECLRSSVRRAEVQRLQSKLQFRACFSPYAFMGSPKSSRSTCTELIVPSRVNSGRPIIGIGVNIYINKVVKITILGLHQQVKTELRFRAFGVELSLERTRASRLPQDGCTLPT